MGDAKSYDPKLDWQAKVEDMRSEWERVQAERGPKEEGDAHHGMPEDGEFTQEIHDYFMRSAPSQGGNGGVLSEKTQ